MCRAPASLLILAFLLSASPATAGQPGGGEPRLIEIEEDRISVERLDPGLPVITVVGGVDLGSLVVLRTDFNEEIVRGGDGL